MSEYLDAIELRILTGSTQARWPKEKELPHKFDSRRIIVSRVYVQAWQATMKRPSLAPPRSSMLTALQSQIS